MKIIATLISVTLFSLSCQSQSGLAQEFGTDYEKVIVFLSSRDFVQNINTDDELIIARTEDYTVTYFFEQEELYKMELVKLFQNRKEASRTLSSFRMDYEMLDAEIMDLRADKENTCFAALANRELAEVSTTQLDKKTTQLRLVRVDMDRIDGSQVDDLRIDNRAISMLGK